MLHDPAVLDLSGAVVLTHDAVDGDGVAGHGLGLQRVVADLAVGAVGAVDGQDITVLVGQFHIAVLGVVHLGDHTGDGVLLLSEDVVLHGQPQSDGFLDGQHVANGRIHRDVRRSDGGVGDDGGVTLLQAVRDDLVSTGLGGQRLPSEGVGGLSQGDNHVGTVHTGIRTGGNGVFPAVDVLGLQIAAIDDDVRHTGILNGHGRGLVETGGITFTAVVADVTGRCTLVIGDRNAVLCPHLLFGGVGHAICLIGKIDRGRIAFGRGREGDDAHQHHNRHQHSDQFAHFHGSVPP